MKLVAISTISGAAVLLSACASWGEPHLPAGASEAQMRADMGTPTDIYPLPAGRELEYAKGPAGQRTWMAKLDADGRLLSLEQVLTAHNMAAIPLGSTKQEVLRAIGRPSLVSHVLLGHYEVWSYRYKENEVWNSMMHFHFDAQGRLRLVLNGPDPDYEDEHRAMR